MEPDEILIGTVGNLREQKRYPDLLEAARSSSTRRRRSGSPRPAPGRRTIRRRDHRPSRGARAGDRFRFLGYVEDTGRFLSACDLFVLASGFEGLAVSMMEALALGLPVVATAVPGIGGEIRDGEEGLLVPVGRPELLAETILTLVRDPERRARMAAEARARRRSLRHRRRRSRHRGHVPAHHARRGSAEPVPQQPERTHR